MFSDGNTVSITACCASAQEHPGAACLPLPLVTLPLPPALPDIHRWQPCSRRKERVHLPQLLAAGSAPPREDRRVVLLPHHPQVIDAIPVVPGVLRGTPNPGSSACLPQTHSTEG